jgi:NACHT domain-containing protein
MDPVTSGVISGLLVNAVTEFSKMARHKLGDRDAIESTVSRAIEDVPDLRLTVLSQVDKGDSRLPAGQVDRLMIFVRSHEAVALARQYLLVGLADQMIARSADLALATRANLAVCGGLSDEAVEHAAPLLDSLLREAVQSAIEGLDAAGVDGYELREAAWRELGLRQLEDIARGTSFLDGHNHAEVAQIYEFERLYRPAVRARYSKITPPTLGARQQVPIDSLYVAPAIKTSALEEDEGIRLSEFRESAFRCVVLGAPGAGKSTLLTKLAYDFAGSQSEQPVHTPIHVTLRDYAVAREQRAVSLLRYMEEQIAIQYSITPPRDAVEYLLLSGRAIVLFDGLDELLVTSLRGKVTQDVEAFATRYPSCPIVVTSRMVGYAEAPLHPEIFEDLYLGDFDDNDVKDYASNYFPLASGLSRVEVEALVASFYEQSAYVADLRVNALMLGLLCNLHQSGYRIPPNRAEVYEKCSTLLFDRWDEDRGIRVEVQARAHFRYAVAFLAYWLYSTPELQSGVTEAQLTRRVAEYLERWLYDDAVVAETSAREFVAFCRGRAWVFTDTGSTALGEPLYQFTHRTFLEYFTAVHLVRTSSGPNELWLQVKDHLENSEWTVPAQSAVQMQDRQREGAGDAFLELLIDRVHRCDMRVQSSLLEFAASLLAGVLVSPRVRTALVKQVIKSSVAINRSREMRDRMLVPVDAATEPLEDFLALSGRPDLAALQAAIKEEAAGLLEHGEEIHEDVSEEQVAKLRVVVALPYARSLASLSSAVPGDIDEAQDHTLPDRATSVLRIAAPSELFCGRVAYEHMVCSLTELIRWHGLNALYFGASIGSKRQVRHVSAVSDRLLLHVIRQVPEGLSHPMAGEDVASLGELISGYNPSPTVDLREVDWRGGFDPWALSPRNPFPLSEGQIAKGSSLVAATFLLAVLAESSEGRGLPAHRGELGPMAHIRAILAARRDEEFRVEALRRVDVLYEGSFKAAMADWVRGEHSFTIQNR